MEGRGFDRRRVIGWASAAALVAVPFLALQVMGDARSAAAEFLVIVAVIGSAGLAIAAVFGSDGGPAGDARPPE